MRIAPSRSKICSAVAHTHTKHTRRVASGPESRRKRDEFYWRQVWLAQGHNSVGGLRTQRCGWLKDTTVFLACWYTVLEALSQGVNKMLQTIGAGHQSFIRVSEKRQTSQTATFSIPRDLLPLLLFSSINLPEQLQKPNDTQADLLQAEPTLNRF